MCMNVDSNFRLRQKITESRLWPVEIMRSVAPLTKAAETKMVRRLCKPRRRGSENAMFEAKISDRPASSPSVCVCVYVVG